MVEGSNVASDSTTWQRIVVAIIAMTIGVSCALASDDIVVTVPSKSEIIPDFSEQSFKEALAKRGAQPLEGVWYYPEEKTTLAIERTTLPNSYNETYRIIFLDSEEISVLPGTIVGYMQQSAQANKFKMQLYCERNKLTLQNPVNCVATINPSKNELLFEKTTLRFRLRVNLTRFLPSLFKGISISANADAPKVPIGFKKIYPASDDDATAVGLVRYL